MSSKSRIDVNALPNTDRSSYPVQSQPRIPTLECFPNSTQSSASSKAGFRDIRVLVVGDLMLDRYILGEVDRISPEAPVPVLRHAHRYQRPGGAANVAMNLADRNIRASGSPTARTTASFTAASSAPAAARNLHRAAEKMHPLHHLGRGSSPPSAPR